MFQVGRTARSGFVLLLVALLFLFSSCSHEASPEEIDQVAGRFFEHLKLAQYGDIYDECAEQFKKNTPRAAIEENLRKVTELGRIQEYRRLSMQFKDADSSRTAWPIYAVLTDQNRLEMTLTFADEKGEWKLLGFEVKRRASS